MSIKPATKSSLKIVGNIGHGVGDKIVDKAVAQIDVKVGYKIVSEKKRYTKSATNSAI